MHARVILTLPFLALALPTSAYCADGVDTAPHAIAPPSLYGENARPLAPGEVIAASRVTVAAGADGNAIRPFASEMARPGAVLEHGAQVGLTSTLSLSATGFNDGIAGFDATSSGATAALRFAPFTSGSSSFVASFGAVRDLGGHGGVFTRASFTTAVGALRFGGTLHGERIFAPTRDSFDVMAVASVSYGLPNALRLGVEWVGQDLEGAIDHDEREGVRHFVGPTVGYAFDRRFSITAGPAIGLSPGSPRTVGRLAIAYGF